MVPQIIVRDGAIEIRHVRIADVLPSTPTTARRGKPTTKAADCVQFSTLPIHLVTPFDGRA